MPNPFLYILKLSCSLAVIWLFYRLLLRNLTFYVLNRWYLLAYSLLAFLIPLIDIGPALESGRPDEPLVLQFIPALGQYTPAVAHTPELKAMTWSAWTIASAILVAGMLYLLVRITVRWLALRHLRRSATLIRGGKWKIYQVDEDITPFSFGKAIYVNRGLHSEKEWEEIVLHEYEHVRGRHTVDILFAEWLTILNWYNPFAWLIRHSIRQNLEFIADREVLAGGFDRKEYQYHLLKVIGQPACRLANNFNFSSLKKRILMMNKLRSARLHLVKFLFILPLVGVLLVAFRDQYNGLWHHQEGPVFINTVGIVIGLPGKEPIQGVTVKEKSTGLQTTTDARGFYQLRIPVTHDSIRVHLDFTRRGYKDDFHENFLPSVKESLGMIDNNALISDTATLHDAFMVIPYMHPPPVDPAYEDALTSMKDLLQENEDAHRMIAMRKAHPEVALFYTIEGRHKELVIHPDGSVEKFGFAGGPTIDDLEKKYGPVPDWLKKDDPGAGTGYLAHWAAISAQAEKDFRPTNHSARAIIFPGDSRVIAVDGSGKARFYDMDNDAPEERPAFEKEYGRLPDCVPAAYHSSRLRLDTVPLPRHDSLKRIGGRDTLGHLPLNAGKKGFMRFMAFDGRSRDSLRKLGRDTVPGKGTDTMRFEIGERPSQDSAVQSGNRPPQPPPLFIVDGVEKDSAVLSTLNPSTIVSIDVLKDSAAIVKYGPKAKNGVVLIYSKPLTPPKP